MGKFIFSSTLRTDQVSAGHAGVPAVSPGAGDMEGAGLPHEGGQLSSSPILGLWHQAPPAKKTKKAVLFFEVEILDARTREKLCFLDKVPGSRGKEDMHIHSPLSPVPLGGVGGWGKGKLRHRVPWQSPDGLLVARRWSLTPPSPRSRACSPRPVRTDGDGDPPPGTPVAAGDPPWGGGDPHHGWGPITRPWGSPSQGGGDPHSG